MGVPVPLRPMPRKEKYKKVRSGDLVVGPCTLGLTNESDSPVDLFVYSGEPGFPCSLSICRELPANHTTDHDLGIPYKYWVRIPPFVSGIASFSVPPEEGLICDKQPKPKIVSLDKRLRMMEAE